MTFRPKRWVYSRQGRTITTGRMRVLGVFVLALAGGPAAADGIIDLYTDTAPPFDTYPVLFPNWKLAPAASFLIGEQPDTINPCAASLTGITIFNYGTASNPGLGGAVGDLAGVYWQLECGAGTIAMRTMTYAGLWVVGGSTYPAWTWAGPVALPNDPCTLCACYPSLQVYVDIGACPTDGTTVALGPGFNTVGNIGGVKDSCGTVGPSIATYAPPKQIAYVMKRATPEVAAPGDTITYTVRKNGVDTAMT
ncbi:MAG: hypothetical protein AAB368_14235, partial [bacterium]